MVFWKILQFFNCVWWNGDVWSLESIRVFVEMDFFQYQDSGDMKEFWWNGLVSTSVSRLRRQVRDEMDLSQDSGEKWKVKSEKWEVGS